MTSTVQAVQAVQGFSVSSLVRTRGKTNGKGMHRLHRLHWAEKPAPSPAAFPPENQALLSELERGRAHHLIAGPRIRCELTAVAHDASATVRITSECSLSETCAVAITCEPHSTRKRRDENASLMATTKALVFPEAA